MNTLLNFKQWSEKSLYKEDLYMRVDETDIQDCFHRYVSFSTGGMRGKLGAGINRINKQMDTKM